MSMDRQDWITRGRLDADAKREATPLKEGTWQHTAYWKGYKSTGEIIHLGRGQTPQSIKAPNSTLAMGLRQKTISKLAPKAAQEHYACLIKELQRPQLTKRMLRLTAACLRMLNKHGAIPL